MTGAVLMVCLAIYLPGLSGLLLFDDRPALTVNQLVQVSGAEFDRWRVAAFSSYSGPCAGRWPCCRLRPIMP